MFGAHGLTDGHEGTGVVAAAYDRLAPEYQAWADAVTPALRERYAARLLNELPSGAAVLEIGCGPGVPVAAQLATRFNVVGVDVSAAMIERAARAVPAARFRVLDIAGAEFESDAFAGVVAFHSLIHVPRDRHAELYAKIFAWVQPGGTFVASLGAHDLPEGREQDWLGGGEMMWSFFDAVTNLELLQAAGFEVETAEVEKQVEPGGVDVEFLWIVARKPFCDHDARAGLATQPSVSGSAF